MSLSFESRPTYLPYREAFDQTGLLWDDAPAWVAARREDAWNRFSATGFPSPRDEEWKYTPVAAIEQTAFRSAPEALLALRQVEPFVPLGFSGPVAVFVNGRFQPALSRLDGLPEGATLVGLHSALALWPEELEPRLMRLAADEDNPFAALNGALAEDGAYLRLRPGIELDQPVLLLHLTVGNHVPVMAHLRHLVVAEANSRVTLLARQASLGEEVHFIDTLTEVAVGEGAAVDYLKLQEESLRAYPLAQLRARVEKGGRFGSRIFSFGGQLSREDVHVELAGEGASCQLDGLYLADGRQHTDTHTRIDHQVPATSSRQTYKGIIAGRARAVFKGRVLVERDAQQTDARQANHNLLLSPEAEIDTTPQLEIYADDVKCSHGATVGQLDENQVFYLRSRGLDESAARGTLTYAFAADVMEAAIPCVGEAVAATLLRRLPGGELAREFFHEF
jgi:Fe-S cluster assembly protein SufD